MEIPPVSNFIPFENDIDLHILKILVILRINAYANFYFLWRSPVNNTICNHFISVKNCNIIAHLKLTVLWNLNPIFLRVIILCKRNYYLIVKSLFWTNNYHVTEPCTFLFYLYYWFRWSHAIKILFLCLLLLSK